jgi:hypothetical protein
MDLINADESLLWKELWKHRLGITLSECESQIISLYKVKYEGISDEEKIVKVEMLDKVIKANLPKEVHCTHNVYRNAHVSKHEGLHELRELNKNITGYMRGYVLYIKLQYIYCVVHITSYVFVQLSKLV